MKPLRSPTCAGLGGAVRQSAAAAFQAAVALSALVALSACEQNSFVPPPPPKVDVGVPVQRAITRYLEATGNAAPIKNVDLVARVQGVLQSINYQDGTFAKEGTTLFTIEPETYKLKLEQAQAAETGAQASLKQTEADFKRQSDLVQRQAVSQATLDQSTSARDNAQANLQQAEVNTKIAAVNYGYTNVVAPFDGIVSAHLVSVGELVGAASPTQLATIVQLDPIYVNFNVNEQDVLRIREEARQRGRPSISRPARSPCAACCPIPIACCCRDFSSGSECPSSSSRTHCWCPTSRSAATRPGATCWSSTARMSSSSARCRPGRWTASCASSKAA